MRVQQQQQQQQQPQLQSQQYQPQQQQQFQFQYVAPQQQQQSNPINPPRATTAAEQKEYHREYVLSQEEPQTLLPQPFRSANNMMSAQGSQNVVQFAQAAQQANVEAEKAKAVLGTNWDQSRGAQPAQMTPAEQEQGQAYLTQLDNDIANGQQGYIDRMQNAGAFARGFRPAGYDTPVSTPMRVANGNNISTNVNPVGVTPEQNNDQSESWTLLGGPEAERNLAIQMQSNQQNPPGAPGGLGHT